MSCKRSHINFSTFSLKFKRKICVQKELIHHFKNQILVTWPTTDLLILRKWCRFENKITIFLFKTWPTNRFWRKKSYNFHFHKNDVTWPLSASGLLLDEVSGNRNRDMRAFYTHGFRFLNPVSGFLTLIAWSLGSTRYTGSYFAVRSRLQNAPVQWTTLSANENEFPRIREQSFPYM